MATLELEARLHNLLDTAHEETANVDVFTPITEREECPICLVTLPIKDREITYSMCCGKRICQGCFYKSLIRDIENGVQKHEVKCAFCRQLTPKSIVKASKKLMKKNDSGAFMQMAALHRGGENGVLQSDTKALEMCIRAAELGLSNAFADIGYHYRRGIVVEQDGSKSLAFYELAAKRGSITGHQVIAQFYGMNDNTMKKSIKHLKVAASAGDQESMDGLMQLYRKKELSKEELTQTLRAYQASINNMKSKDRDEARVYFAERLSV